MVQALAAKLWLDRRGLETQMRLAAAKAEDGGLDAHVWLLCGGSVVTGGPLEDGWAAFETGSASPSRTKKGDAAASPFR